MESRKTARIILLPGFGNRNLFPRREMQKQGTELRTEGGGAGGGRGERWHRRLLEGAVPRGAQLRRSARTVALGWGVGGRLRGRGNMHTYSGFMLLYSGN